MGMTATYEIRMTAIYEIRMTATYKMGMTATYKNKLLININCKKKNEMRLGYNQNGN